MPRRKKPVSPAILEIERDSWLLKNFLTPAEKRALIGYYHGQIKKTLEEKRDDDLALNVEVERDIKRFSGRINFIIKHF